MSTYGTLAKVLNSSPRAVGQVRLVRVSSLLCMNRLLNWGAPTTQLYQLAIE